MANEFIDNRWILDTAAAGMQTTDPVYIKRVRWVGTGLTAGTSAISIQDAASKILWESLATGTTVVESDLVERWWHSGFKIPTLAGGRVIIELGEAP